VRQRTGHLLLRIAQSIAFTGFKLLGGTAEDWPNIRTIAANLITFRKVYEEVMMRKQLAEQARLSELFERAWYRSSEMPKRQERAN
jgi:hypothetical protein